MGAPFRTASPPPITAPDHVGDRQPDAIYWAEPPTRIGALVSAWSNQTTSGFATNRSARAFAIVVPIVALMAVAVVYTAYDHFGLAGGLGGAALVAGFCAFAYIEAKSRPWCSYIGDAGFSEHRVTWRRTEHTIIAFESIAGLWISRTEHYNNGVYQHTVVEYEWRDRAGLQLALRRATLHERGLAAAGARFGAGGKPRRNPISELMEAATRTWQRLRAERARTELREHGAVVFPTRRGGFFTVRRGAIETDITGKTTTITPTDLNSSKLDAGILTLKTRHGKLRFAISDIADSTLAVALANEVAGISLDLS